LGYLHPGYAIGKQLVHNNINFPIIGVIRDFHQQSLEKKVEPIVFQFAGNDYEADEYYLVKVKTSNLPTAIHQIQDEWSSVFKGNPFSYFFLDDYFNQQYKNEMQFGMLFGFFSLIAIVIACIGLFALVAFMVRQRAKEIGVRKVLGASLQHVMILLTKEFIQLILLANIISWPLGWFLMNNWLSDFAYRISISWWIFGLSGLTAVFIALATISFQAFKAATANPVKALRSD
jgi:putative ABC transport system permease protein